MVAWFIIAIATLAVFALIAVNGVQTVAATTDGVGRLETTRRVEAAAAAIAARTGSPSNTGKAMVLAGATVDGVYGLPAELSSLASTPFGQRITYCPFGDGESGTASSVPLGGGATYPVEVKQDQTGRVYVTAGRPDLPQVRQNTNLMAFLVAPRTKSSPTATCGSVRFNPTTGRFEAPDAIVRPVIRATAGEDQRQQAGREVVYYVSETGNGRGLTPDDPTSLYAATTYYRSALPQAMRIVMTVGRYQLPAQYLNATVGGFSDKGNGGSLVIEGAGSQLDFAGTSDVRVPGNLELRNLTVSSAVGLFAEQGRSLRLFNTSTGYVKVKDGGHLQGSNVAITDSRTNGYALEVNDGSDAALAGNVTIVAAANQNNAFVGGGSTMAFENANADMRTISGGTNVGIYAEENSSLVFRSSYLTYNANSNFPVLVRGKASFINSYLTMNVFNDRMIEVQGGGFLTLFGGVYGQNAAPVTAIIDAGAAGVSGTATVRARSTCWYDYTPTGGTQFERSAAGNGSTSVVTNDENPVAMSPNPTNAEITANAAVNARNAQRASLRGTNTSNFTCQI